MLSISKDVNTNVSLDVLKLIDQVARDVASLVDNSYYHDNINADRANKNLQSIRGRMMVLKGIVDCSKGR